MELVGRLCAGESSWPKNVHFLDADFGVEGLVGGRGARSASNGLERCLRGLGRSNVGDIGREPSNLAEAVLGRVSTFFGLRRWSFEGGLEADMIEDRLPETEWPPGRIVVPELSLETRERGRGINWISSENPTLARLEGFPGELFSEPDSFTSCPIMGSMIGNGE